jgi:hypothetical protein
MTSLEIVGGQLIIHITGWDVVWAFKKEVSFPLASITKAYPYDASISPPWLKNPGTGWPGVIVAGTYQNLSDRQEFWCNHFKGNTLVMDLANEKYTRIVVDLPPDQPVDEWIARLNSVIYGRSK